jgi:hypothetical protein
MGHSRKVLPPVRYSCQLDRSHGMFRQHPSTTPVQGQWTDADGSTGYTALDLRLHVLFGDCNGTLGAAVAC